MKFTELLRLLKGEGARFVRQAAGSAQIFEGADGTPIVVHVHPSKEVPTGTAAKALKLAREARERAKKKGQE